MKRVLITGGAGFIGSNLAHRLLSLGVPVRILDNLSRRGSRENLMWLRHDFPEDLEVVVGDVRKHNDIEAAIQGVDQVFHFAAQVAVTSSVTDPETDFDINARGTLNVLEAIRHQLDPPGLIFTSTNKVYGALEDIDLERRGDRYEPRDPNYREGVDESRPLDFHSPYGCSKGAADQYIRDYARIYGLSTIVFRMSCIYGPRQFGNEDQGWVAHFLMQAMRGEAISIYGDGAQVRDILFAGDLVDAFLQAESNIERLAGRAFNIGGGAANSISLLDLLRKIDDLSPYPTQVRFDEWRPGDQRYYVSDCSSFREATGWSPEVGVNEGIRRLHEWVARRAAVMQEV